MALEEQEAGQRMIDVRYCSPAVQVERKARDQSREIPELNTNTNTQHEKSIQELSTNTNAYHQIYRFWLSKCMYWLKSGFSKCLVELAVRFRLV